MGQTGTRPHAIRRRRRRAGTRLAVAVAVAGLALFAVVLAPGAAAQAPSTAVSIPDPSLRGAIEGALGKQSGDTITRDDMAGLTALDARYSGVRQVDGLQHAVNLRALYLQGNGVSAASSLTNLTKMQTLFLQDNNISSIDLTQMTDLRFLNIGNNSLSTVDLSSQRTRVGQNNQSINSKLYALWLNGNRLTSFDITGLTALDDTSGTNSDPRLVSLRLDGNQLASITGISDLPGQAWSLRLEDNQLTSVDLTGAEHLHYVYLDRNPISSTSSIVGLSGLTGLRRLHLYETGISSIDLSPFSQLERAFLNDNNLTSVDVTGLDSLNRLWLRGNEISSLAGLDDVAASLQYLNLRTNRLSSIDVSKLTNLRHLYLSDNTLTSIDVTSLTRLQVLWLHNGVDASLGSAPNPSYQNQVTSVGRLPDSLTDLRLTGNPLTAPITVSSRTGLKKLYLSGDQISGISQVTNLTGLTELGLTDMSLESADLSGLSRLSALEKLDLSGNLILDAGSLPSFARLTELRLDDNDLVDVSPLSDMTALEYLYVAGNHIPDFSPLDALVAEGLTIHGADEQLLERPDTIFWDWDAAGTGHGQSIRLLAADGVLDNTECGLYRICPRDRIERWVVAIWLVRVLEGGDPEPLGYNQFEDVHPGLQWAAHAQRLADLGITAGCSADPALFCPKNPVTRAQMASLLAGAFDLPSASSAEFVDVDGQSSHAADIGSVAAAGIASGCAVDPARFCPDDLVTRGQMATFLERARTYIKEN